MKERPFTIITFQPLLECEDCPQLTDTAVLNPELGNRLYPVCPLHALACYPSSRFDHPSPKDLDEQHMLIGRFVLQQFGNTGRVLLISRIQDLHTIPGYREIAAADLDLTEAEFHRQHIKDIGWLCRWESAIGDRVDLNLVWRTDWFEFEVV